MHSMQPKKFTVPFNSAYVPVYQKLGGQKSYASEASRIFWLLWLQLAHLGLGGDCLP